MIPTNSQECLRTLRIIRTNGINLQEDGGTTGVYLRFSRINHSCAPSAVRNIEPSSGLIRVIAAKDIEKGEEITIKVGGNNNFHSECLTTLFVSVFRPRDCRVTEGGEAAETERLGLQLQL